MIAAEKGDSWQVNAMQFFGVFVWHMLGMPESDYPIVKARLKCWLIAIHHVAHKREEVMKLSRRHLAAAGALALSAPTLIRSALAQSADEATVKKAVEELRTAWIKQDKAKIKSLTAEQLSYSHSDARLQNKAEFIDGVMTRKGTLKSLEWPDMSVQVVGNNAVVRHLWVSETELDGKVTNTKIGVM